MRATPLPFPTMRQRARRFIAAVLMTSAAPCALAEVTIADYPHARTQPWFREYVLGVGVGASWANTIGAVESGRRLFCVPTRVTLDADDYLRLLEAAVREEVAPGTADSTTAVELLLIRRLQREYPCGPLLAAGTG